MLFLIILIVYCTSDIVYWKILCLGGLKRLNNIYLHLYSNTKQCTLKKFEYLKYLKYTEYKMIVYSFITVRYFVCWRHEVFMHEFWTYLSVWEFLEAIFTFS